MPEINAVSIKPPAFDPHRPAAYFAILEAQFQLSGITVENTKFYHCLASLPTETVAQLPSSTLSDPSYANLKKVLLSLHEASLPEKFAKLASSAQLTGRPSEYMKQLTSIAADLKIGDEIVRHRFISALSPNLQPVVAAQKETPLEQLAQLADDLVSLSVPQTVNAVNSSPRQRQSFHSRQHQQSPSSFQQFNSRQTTPNSLQPFHSDQKPRVCRSHIYFGKRARNCRQWCEWPDKQNCTIAQSRQNTPHHSRPNSPQHPENASATA